MVGSGKGTPKDKVDAASQARLGREERGVVEQANGGGRGGTGTDEMCGGGAEAI